jgi:hypothetical protein
LFSRKPIRRFSYQSLFQKNSVNNKIWIQFFVYNLAVKFGLSKTAYADTTLNPFSMIRIVLLLAFVFSFCQKSYSQQLRISEKPDDFIKSWQDVMTATQNAAAPDAIKSIDELWKHPRFAEARRGQLVAVSNSLQKKGYKPIPHQLALVEALLQAAKNENIETSVLEPFLATVQKTAELSDSKTFQTLLNISKAYFSNRAVYNSNYNRLYLFSGNVTFKYFEQPFTLNAPTATPAPAGQNKPAENEKTTFDEWDAPSTSALESIQKPAEVVVPQVIAAGPAIEIKVGTLVIATPSDSASLINTNVTIGFKEGILLGNGGKFSWETVGQPEVFADLGNYRMEVRNPKLVCDNATLTHPKNLTTPIKGIFEFQSKKRAKNVVASYPRFMSFDNNIALKNLNTADIEYRGGFALAGRRVYSSSVNSRFATLLVKQQGKLTFRCVSKRFEVSDTLLSSPSSTFTAYIDTDSLFHPAVKLFFDKSKGFVRLSKLDDSGFKQTMFEDNYHKFYILADQMRWSLTDQKMDFLILRGKNVVPALFESFDYFSPQRFQEIPGPFNFNPLLVLANYTRTKNVSSANVYDLATAYRQDVGHLRNAMLYMMQQGFVEYDAEVENLKLSRKGLHYLNANAGRKDYDSFVIPSFYVGSGKDSSSTANATISLKDNQLTIRGVKQFHLSDSLNVYVAPSDQVLKITKNRNLIANGELKTGNFRFRGKEFAFNYNDFSVKFSKIDSITFVPQKEIAKGGKTEIGGDLRYESGVVYINKPDNKSGKVRLPEFPRLVVPNGVTAYFDQPYRVNGAYSRKVFFKVPSIDFDSLNVKDIDFVGTFTSDGIFPPFKETLISMPDNSLGFSHVVPNGKYPLYNGSSSMNFAGPLLMDKKGLHADGEINHLTAAIKAQEAFFTPDSVTATGNVGQIKEGQVGNSYFTKVDIKDFSLKWKPRVDSMVIVTKTNAFDFYEASCHLVGRLIVRQTGLFGLGTLKRTDSEIVSERFKFGKEQFTASMADVKIGENFKAIRPQLTGSNTEIDFDIAKNLVQVKVSDKAEIADTSLFYFPYVAYKTNMRKAVWEIANKRIAMKGDLRKTFFAATEPSQEGLVFNGMEAIYELEKYSLNLFGVPAIKTADAKIIPNRGEVTVRKDAEMRPLFKARVQIDTLFGYHNLTDGNIRILSAKRFEGDATYQFVNSLGDTTNIKMGNFELVARQNPGDSKKKEVYFTQAKAILEERDKFHISPQLLYRGSISMVAYEKNLILDGFIRPDLKNRTDVGNFWIPFKGKNTDEVKITVDQSLRGESVSLSSGLHFRRGVGGLYTTFLSGKENAKDDDIFNATGQLFDFPKQKSLEIVPLEKAAGRSYEGTRYIFSDSKKSINLEGRFNLANIGDLLESAGTAKINSDSSLRYDFDQMMVFNFELPQQALVQMGEKIIRTNLNDRTNVKSADEKDDKDALMVKLGSLYGHKAVETYRTRGAFEHVPLHTAFPKIAPAMLTLTKVNLKWSGEQNTFYSVGKVGVANIGAADVNAEMDGYIEIRKNPEGDDVYVYLEATPEVWYYFGFLKNQMGAMSSDGEFNAQITAKAKTIKAKNYSLTVAEANEKDVFVDHFVRTYMPKSLIKDPKDPKKSIIKKEDKPADKKKKADETKEGF